MLVGQPHVEERLEGDDIAEDLLHDRARLDTLAVRPARQPLRAAPQPERQPVRFPREPVARRDEGQVARASASLEGDGRVLHGLRNVDGVVGAVVPLGGLEGPEEAEPVVRLLAKPVAELEQERLAGAVVEPVKDLDLIRRARLGPLAQGPRGQVGLEVAGVAGEGLDRARVARGPVVVAQDPACDHARPPVGVGGRADLPVLALVVQEPLDPGAGLSPEPLVGEAHEPAEVVGPLLPVLAGPAAPGALGSEVGKNLLGMAGQAVRLTLELAGQPAAGPDRAERAGGVGQGLQGRARRDGASGALRGRHGHVSAPDMRLVGCAGPTGRGPSRPGGLSRITGRGEGPPRRTGAGAWRRRRAAPRRPARAPRRPAAQPPGPARRRSGSGGRRWTRGTP